MSVQIGPKDIIIPKIIIKKNFWDFDKTTFAPNFWQNIECAKIIGIKKIFVQTENENV